MKNARWKLVRIIELTWLLPESILYSRAFSYSRMLWYTICMKLRAQERVSVQLFSKVFNILPVPAVVFFAHRGAKPMANAEARKLFGAQLAALVKPTLAYMVAGKPRAYPKEELPWVIALEKGIGARKEDVVLLGRGKKRTVHTQLRAFAMPIHEKQQVIAAIAVFEDITDVRMLEEDVYGRTIKLEVANEHLKELDRVKSEFVSLASHQLKTPLTAIRWFLELVLEGDAGELAPKQHEYLMDAMRAVLRLVELMNFLLNISRIETGKLGMTPKPIDVIEFVKGVLREAEPMLASKAHTISLEAPGYIGVVSFDEKLVREILLNLLSNAVKYTPAAGSISVCVSRKKDAVEFAVRDTGVGIPAAEQKHLFEKFFRASNASYENTEGTGLGLYLARALVEMCGGTMGFTSQESRGSSFFFTLPLEPPASVKGEKRLADYPTLIPTFRGRAL